MDQIKTNFPNCLIDWDKQTKDNLGTDKVAQPCELSHTGKTVENKGTGEKERGEWERLEGWKLKIDKA